MKTNIIGKSQLTSALTVILLIGCITQSQAVEIHGAEDNPNVLMRWHRISLTFDDPATSETVGVPAEWLIRRTSLGHLVLNAHFAYQYNSHSLVRVSLGGLSFS